MLSLPVEFDFYSPEEGKGGIETYPNTKGVAVYAPFDGVLEQGPEGTVYVLADSNDVAPFLPSDVLRTSFRPVKRTRSDGAVKAGDMIGIVTGDELVSSTVVGHDPITLEELYRAAQASGLRVKDPGVEDLSRRKKGNPYALLAVGCLSAASISLLLWGKSK